MSSYSSEPDFDSKLGYLNVASANFGIEILSVSLKESTLFELERTISLLETADRFIADLSHERPSCYFEVGYMQGLGKTGELIAIRGTRIHQVKGEVKFYSDFSEFKELIYEVFARFSDETYGPLQTSK